MPRRTQAAVSTVAAALAPLFKAAGIDREAAGRMANASARTAGEVERKHAEEEEKKEKWAEFYAWEEAVENDPMRFRSYAECKRAIDADPARFHRGGADKWLPRARSDGPGGEDVYVPTQVASWFDH